MGWRGRLLRQKPYGVNKMLHLMYEFQILPVESYGDPFFAGTDNKPLNGEVIMVGEGDGKGQFCAGGEIMAGFDENAAAADIQDILLVFPVAVSIINGHEVGLSGILSFFCKISHGPFLFAVRLFLR